MMTIEAPCARLDPKFIPLMSRFGDAFTGERIWLRELLQNARRAGATRISILTDPSDPNYLRIEDNGFGIADFQVLLDPGHSNWTDVVTELELPFGVGFWSAIDVSRRVEVCSRGWRGIFQRGRILDGEWVPFDRCTEETATSITLHLKKPILEGAAQYDPRIRFQRQLEVEVCGFPVPIYLNGQPILRPYALDVWDGLRFAFPEAVALVDLNYARDAGDSDMTFFQGLPLGNDGWKRGRWPSVCGDGLTIYLHLTGNGWRLKAPDRIGLYQSQEVQDKITALHRTILRTVGEHVVRAGQTEQYFDHLIRWGCADLVREYPIPEKYWARIKRPLHLPHYEGDYQEEATATVPAEEIPAMGSSRRFLLTDSFCFYPDEETISHHFAAYALALPILQAWNDPEHWVRKHRKAEPFELFLRRPLKIEVRPNDKVAEGEWNGWPIVVCKAYYLQVRGYGRKRLTVNAFLNGTCYIIDGPYRNYYPVDQAESFQTEMEGFNEARYEEAMSDFRARLAIILKDYSRLIEWALEKYVEPLKGRVFTINAGENGIVVRETSSIQ